MLFNFKIYHHEKVMVIWVIAVCPQPTTVGSQPILSVRNATWNQSLMCLHILDHGYIGALKSILGLRASGINLFRT